MKKEKHTSTPLRLSKPLGDTYYIEDSKGSLVAQTANKHGAPNKETAEFIIKSYNNHDMLVSALDNMVSWMTEFGEVPESDMPFNEAKQLLNELKEE